MSGDGSMMSVEEFVKTLGLELAPHHIRFLREMAEAEKGQGGAAAIPA